MSIVFNKNHITINKYIVKNKKDTNKFKVEFIRNYGQKTFSSFFNKVKVRKKSKLGFWYLSEKTSDSDSSEYDINKIILHLGNVAYDIIYPYHSNEQYICTDIHPWEIVSGDGIFDEHYMHDLENDINNILNDILECSYYIEYTERYYNTPNSIYDKSADMFKPKTLYSKLKHILFKDLFGNPNGIRFQTDSEKLLSHGFDEKMSFRKRKSEK